MSRTLPIAALAACAVASCRYELPIPDGEDVYAAGGAAPFSLAIQPAAAVDAVPAVAWFRLEAPPDGATSDAVAVASGDLSSALLRELETGAVSDAFSEKLVDALAWTDADGTIVVAPSAVLDPDTTYSVALSNMMLAVSLRTSAAPPAVTPRIWPPDGEARTAGFAVWCGDAPLEGDAVNMTLEPHGPGAIVAAGVDGVDRRCVSLRAPVGAVDVGPFAAPPAFGVAATSLDPRPLRADLPPAPSLAPAPVACAAGEIAFGLACGAVEDDAITLRTPDAPLLWSVLGAGVERVWATGAGEPAVVTGLPIDADVALAVTMYDTAGEASTATLRLHTSAARAHVVLSEVLANPLGAEPAQEWVELYNDGAVAAELGGFVLVDIGGATVLPQATLAPGAYALIVGDDYVEDDGFDARAATNTLLLRVPRVGKSGLSNEGEPLSLRTPNGLVVSTFPAAPKPDAGQSVIRTTPRAPDGVASSFAIGSPSPGARNIASPL